jgi:hypothetical protein
MPGVATILQDMSSVRRVPGPAQPTATAKPLLLGAHVRLPSSGATGVVIGYPPERDRVFVRWDDSGEVTRCLKAKLVPMR